MRRRWLVLLVGEGRLAAGHRTELSRHRTLEGARAAALEALARLREGPTGSSRDYTVIIERNGERFDIHETEVPPAPPATEPVVETTTDENQIIVPARHVPGEVASGLRDREGRMLPGPGPVPPDVLAEWERKVAGDAAAEDDDDRRPG